MNCEQDVYKWMPRLICNIRPKRITNEEFWELTGMKKETIKQRKCKPIGHILRKPFVNITRHALDYGAMGIGERKPKTIGKRTI